MAPAVTLPSTGREARLSARSTTWTTPTSGVAPNYLQANLIVLPSRFASDFRLLCHRNPVPCPLLAESACPGSFTALKSHIGGVPDDKVAPGIDIRTDAPKYMVYRDSVLAKFQCADIRDEWTDDHVAFLIGCSYSFERALSAAGLPPRHMVMGRNVPMYRTKVPLCPAGVFTGGTYVVSMRPYRRSDVRKVRGVTRPFAATHGEPIDWGWDALGRLGIKSVNAPEWGDEPLTEYGNPLTPEDDVVPVFWGCGVTPQNAVMAAKLPGVMMGHAPGHMIVLDVKEEDIMNA